MLTNNNSQIEYIIKTCNITVTPPEKKSPQKSIIKDIFIIPGNLLLNKPYYSAIALFEISTC